MEARRLNVFFRSPKPKANACTAFATQCFACTVLLLYAVPPGPRQYVYDTFPGALSNSVETLARSENVYRQNFRETS